MTNPEFKRNLWLQFSTHRLIAMPALLGLTFLAGAATSAQTLSSMTMPAFILLVWLWGTRNVSASIIDELRDKTWDQQRMSALQPWTMTWGKLFGATSFTWYGGLICTAVAIALGVSGGTLPAALRHAAILISVGVMLHASAIALNLHASRVEATVIQRGGVAWIVILMGLSFFPWTYAARQETVHWWNVAIGNGSFLLASSLFFAACAVFAAWRVMCNALQVRTLPWAWPLFGVILAAYLTGLGGEYASAAGFFRVAVLVGAGMTYAALFTEPNGIPLWQRAALRLRKGDLRGMLEHLPIWTTSLALTFVCALLAIVLGPNGRHLEAFAGMPDMDGLLAAIAFAVLRDSCVLLFFAFGKNPKRVEGTAALYLVVIYGLLPFLAGVLHLDALRYFLLPVDPPHPVRSTAIMALHAAIAFGLVQWRWRTRPRYDD